jgi:PAS domain S-box-containing protein
MSFDFSISTAVLASGLASAVLALALWYLSTVPDAPDVTRWWAGGFLVNTLRHLVMFCGGWMSPALCTLLAEWAQATTAILLIAGTLRYTGRGGRQGWVLLAVPAAGAWAVLFTLAYPHFLLLTVPLYGLGGLAMLYAGWAFLRNRPGFARSGHRAVGWAFVLWGLHKLDYPLLRPVQWFAPLGFMLSEALTMVIAVALIILVQRRQQHLAEQAMQRARASKAELQASEARYRDLIDNSVMGVVIYRNREMIYANPAVAVLYGYPSPAALKAEGSLEVLSDPEEVPRLRAYAKARLRGEPAPERYEFRGRRRDGTTVWLENTVRVIDWQGEPAVQNSLYDISDGKRFQEELRSHQLLLRTVIDSVPHVILVRDREGRMLMANRAWSEAFGLVVEANIGRTTAELGVLPSDEAEAVHRKSLAVVASEQATSHEHEITQRNGRRRYHTIRTPLRDASGRVEGVVSISLDITEQRTMEEQLRQAQKMEAVGQLTGGVAHDFNNLLSVILGNLELLEAHMGADARAVSYAQRAMKATERGAALTQRLLAFSRRQTLQPADVDLCRQVIGLMDLLRSSLGETIRIETRLDSSAGSVRVDPNQLENTLLNLALNARDAMPDGGLLTIAVVPLSSGDLTRPGAGSAGEQGWLMLSVQDSGTGMSESVLARAVEPFFTTKGPGSGSGLGLSMIYGFIEQSGGHMTLESQEGQGTTVRLFFRRVDTSAAAGAGTMAQDALPLGTAETVLVVEDDPALGHLAVEMLAELNYTAIRAMDGQEALQALRENPQVGLLFTDVVLPNGMDGVMLAGEARRMRPDLKVIFTSGYAETVFERHPVGMKGSDLVQKPYRLGDLAHKLRLVLGREVPRSS